MEEGGGGGGEIQTDAWVLLCSYTMKSFFLFQSEEKMAGATCSINNRKVEGKTAHPVYVSSSLLTQPIHRKQHL